MSSPKEKPELLAGHPPAVVAGGKRIVQHKKDTGEPKAEMTPADEAEFGPAQEKKEGEVENNNKRTKPDTHNQQMLLSGVVTKGDRDFQAEAIKHHHDKPHCCPSHEKTHHQPLHNIHQPRK